MYRSVFGPLLLYSRNTRFHTYKVQLLTTKVRPQDSKLFELFEEAEMSAATVQPSFSCYTPEPEPSTSNAMQSLIVTQNGSISYYLFV